MSGFYKIPEKDLDDLVKSWDDYISHKIASDADVRRWGELHAEVAKNVRGLRQFSRIKKHLDNAARNIKREAGLKSNGR